MSQPTHHRAGHDHRDQCVALVPIFAQLNDEERHEIARHARQRHYRKNELLYSAGEDSPYLMIVHRGRVKTYRGSDSGHEQLLRVLEPGDFMGETSFITAGRVDHFAAVLEDAEVCSLHHEDIQGFLVRYPSIAYKMLQAVTQRLERTEKLVGSLTGEDAGHRVAAYLLEASAGAESFTLPVSKKDLASYLGTTPETLSRRLAGFESRGWIRQGPAGLIRIVNRAALKAA